MTERSQQGALAAEKRADRQMRAAWAAVFRATDKLRKLIEKEGGTMQVDFKLKGGVKNPLKKKGARRGK